MVNSVTGSPTPASVVAQQAGRVGAFTDMIGVNTHVGYNAAVGEGDDVYDNFGMTVDSLKYLGVHNVRDNLAYDYYNDRVEQLGAMGIKFNFYMGTGDYVDYAAEIKNLEAHASIINSIEGPNEVDTWPAIYNGQTGYSAAVALMKALYADVHGSTALNGSGHSTPVYNLTLGDTANYTHLGNLAPYTDYSSAHIYPPGGAAPKQWIEQYLKDSALDAPGHPSAITEGGYSTLPQNTDMGSVSEAVQAKYTLDYLLDAYKAGVAKTYLYELLDEHADPAGTDREQHYGLFHNDGTPKPAATAIHNLMTVMDDAGVSFTPGKLAYGVTGMPTTADQALFQKSDGTFVLALWDEPQIWDNANFKDITVPAAKISLDLGQSASTIHVLDPLVSASTPVQTAANTQHLDLNLPDHPVFIEIAAAATSSSPPPTPSPQDTITLHVSEDAWRGNAVFKFLVDGQQIGSKTAVTASHAAGQWQDITFHTDLALATKAIAVQFTNDAWGGDAAHDRNLYVQSATINGHTLTPDDQTLLRTGETATFDIAHHPEVLA